MTQKLINQYHFNVNWGGKRSDFAEVSGLNIEIETIRHRYANSPSQFAQKAPGLLNYSEVTFTRNIELGDTDFFDWISTKHFTKIERRDILITLLNEEHNPVYMWKLRNCFPIKYIGPTLRSRDSLFASESLVITHEGMTVENI